MENVIPEDPTSETLKRLIVDASIARAAGRERTAELPLLDTIVTTPKNCRDLLNAVLRLGFRMTMTPEIVREWDDHQGSFALGWRVAMRTAGKIEIRPSCRSGELREAITGMAGQQIGKVRVTEDVCRIMLKDCHLLEAALETDKIILALDEKARNPMRTTAQVIEAIRQIVWVNPDKPEEQAIAWLEAGATPEKHRQLGFRHERVP